MHALIGEKPMFYQSIKQKKRALLFCACKVYIIKQMKKPKPARNVENSRLRLWFSAFLSCSQMAVVVYYSVIHGLGFIC